MLIYYPYFMWYWTMTPWAFYPKETIRQDRHGDTK